MAVFKRGDGWAVKVYDPATKGQRWVGTYPSRREAKDREAGKQADETPPGRPLGNDETYWWR